VRSEYNVRRKELLIEEQDLSGIADGAEIVIEAGDSCGNKAVKVFNLQR
jgi:hypothetical protein